VSTFFGVDPGGESFWYEADLVIDPDTGKTHWKPVARKTSEEFLREYESKWNMNRDPNEYGCQPKMGEGRLYYPHAIEVSCTDTPSESPVSDANLRGLPSGPNA
jgi:hypothetical protein